MPILLVAVVAGVTYLLRDRLPAPLVRLLRLLGAAAAWLVVGLSSLIVITLVVYELRLASPAGKAAVVALVGAVALALWQRQRATITSPERVARIDRIAFVVF